jgi:hypothetical protein
MQISKTTILGFITALLAILASWRPSVFSDETNAVILDIIDKGWVVVSLIIGLVASFGAKDEPLGLKNLGQ